MGQGYTTAAALRLDAPLVVSGRQPAEGDLGRLPRPGAGVGARLLIFRQPLGDNLQSVGTVNLPESATQSVVTSPLNETVDGTSTYNLQFFVGFTIPTAFIYAVRVGYLPPPQAFVPVSPSKRVPTRSLTGGKLNPNEERIVTLDGVPSFAARRRHQRDRDGDRGRRVCRRLPGRDGVAGELERQLVRPRSRTSPTRCSPPPTPTVA